MNLAASGSTLRSSVESDKSEEHNESSATRPPAPALSWKVNLLSSQVGIGKELDNVVFSCLLVKVGNCHLAKHALV